MPPLKKKKRDTKKGRKFYELSRRGENDIDKTSFDDNI